MTFVELRRAIEELRATTPESDLMRTVLALFNTEWPLNRYGRSRQRHGTSPLEDQQHSAVCYSAPPGSMCGQRV